MNAVTLKLAKNYADSISPKAVDIKHRALVCSMDQTPYGMDLRQLNSHGFGVEVTTLVAFTKNYLNWINDFDILVITNARGEIPFFSDVTAAQAKAAIVDWMARGKQIIFYIPYSTSNAITKLNVVGSAAETASLADVFPVTFETKTLTSAGVIAHSANYPAGLEEMLTGTYTPDGSVANIVVTDQTVLLTATEGATVANITVYKPGKYAIVGRCGELTVATSGYMRYADMGVIARLLIGDTSGVKLAQDCQYNRRIASFAIDGDVTTETQAMTPYLESFRNCKLEIGLVVNKLTADLINWYRSRFQDVEYVSHTDTHLTAAVTVTDETHVIPSSQYITLDKGYWLQDINITYVKTSDDATTYTVKGAYGTNPSATECLYDCYARTLQFAASEIGKTVKITYTTFDEGAEWIGSIRELKTLALQANDAIYLTAAKYSVSPMTMLQAIRDDIMLCDHIHPMQRCHMLLRTGLLKKIIPLVYPTWVNPATQVGFDSECYLATSAVAISTSLPTAVSRVEAKNQPILWYSHDFITSETDTRSLHGGTNWNADWTKATYAATIANVQSFFASIISYLDAKNVLWMRRSDYSRWYNALNGDVAYSSTVTNGITEVTIQNAGKKPIKGLTFRQTVATSPTSIYTVPAGDLPFAFANGEVRFCIDLLAGETVKVRIK